MLSASASMKSLAASIRSPYCAISEPCRSSWPVSQTPPQQAIQLRRHRLSSFCRACESRGKKEQDARPTGQLRSRSESDDAPIRSSKPRHSCANGSRPSRGEPAANSCPSFRPNTPGFIRAKYSERSNVASNCGAASKQARCCLAPEKRRRKPTRRAQGWRDAPPPPAACGLDHARSPVCWLCKRSVADRARHRRARNADQLCERHLRSPGEGAK